MSGTTCYDATGCLEMASSVKAIVTCTIHQYNVKMCEHYVYMFRFIYRIWNNKSVGWFSVKVGARWRGIRFGGLRCYEELAQKSNIAQRTLHKSLLWLLDIFSAFKSNTLNYIYCLRYTKDKCHILKKNRFQNVYDICSYKCNS